MEGETGIEVKRGGRGVRSGGRGGGWEEAACAGGGGWEDGSTGGDGHTSEAQECGRDRRRQTAPRHTCTESGRQTATDGEGGESMSERLAGSCRHIICGGGRGEGAVQRGRV